MNKLTNKEISFLRKYRPWGIILFTRNIKSIDQQLKVCLKKGGIKESDPYELFRFEVKRFHH